MRTHNHYVRLINELRSVRVGPAGSSIEARERVRGIDVTAGSMAVLFERHTPVDVRQVGGVGHEVTHTFSNHGIVERVAPYLAAPFFAMLITKLARAKGRR